MTATSTGPGPDLIRKLSLAPLSSFAMLAGLQLDLFTSLAERPCAAGELADVFGSRTDRLELLLHALVATGLLDREDGRFVATPVAARYLARSSPDYVGELHEALHEMWNAALRSAETIRTGTPQARIDFASMSQEELESFYRGFYGEVRTAGRELAAAYDFSGVRTLIDVGGGSGGLAIALTERWPEIRATVADLPSVVPITERFLAKEGASERVRAVVADVVKEPLPGSYDVAVLRALLQVLSAEEARCVVRNVAAAVVPGGRIFILGRILHNSRLSPDSTVFTNLVFLNIFPEGQAYTESQYRGWLEEAGFEDIEFDIPSDGRSSVRARKPESRA